MNHTKENTLALLRAARDYVQEVGSDAPCQPGCIEDALMQAIYGRSWFLTGINSINNDAYVEHTALKEAFHQHPAYLACKQEVEKRLPDYLPWRQVYDFSDSTNKAGRIAFLDDVIAELEAKGE